LVSEYFSNAYSHDIPIAPDIAGKNQEEDHNSTLMQKLRTTALGTEINEYVLSRAPAFAKTASFFFGPIKNGVGPVLKYEDYIFDKPGLVRAICEHFEITLSDEAVASIAKKTDLQPKVENPRAFVRKVTPGDHKEKLTSDTVSRLNEALAPVLESFGYLEEA
jgi:hypothetical protein